MAYAGQVISNPVSGETIEFVKTSADTDGELLAIDLTLTPDGHVPGTHVHPEQDERFEVKSGTMKFKLGHKTIIAGPGETVVVPAGKRHRFSNAGTEDAHVRVEVKPALRMEDLFETTVALANEGRVLSTGMPKPLDLALFVREYQREVRAAFPPPWVVRLTTAPLAALARRRGHANRYRGLARPAGIPALASA
jgi:mannose-6-phosphate isomerase-like protein (cupin superfamily)